MRWWPLLLLAACGLPPESAKRVADCAALYMECVDRSLSMSEYRYCRSVVDMECLDGGAP